MLASVLDYLKRDDELVAMLDHRREYPKITPYTAHDKNAYPYITVKLTPFDLDILTGQYRCELKIVTNDDLMVEKLTRRVTDILHFGTRPGLKINNETLFHSSHAGSGFLFDEEKEVFEQTLFFSMIFKR